MSTASFRTCKREHESSAASAMVNLCSIPDWGAWVFAWNYAQDSSSPWWMPIMISLVKSSSFLTL